MGETPRGFESHWVQTKYFFLLSEQGASDSCSPPTRYFFAKEHCCNLPLDFSGPFTEEIFCRLEVLLFGPFRVCCDTCLHSFWWRVIGTCWHFINKTACPSGLRRMTRNHLGLPAQVQILLLSITFCPPLAYGEEGLLAQAVPLAPCTDLQ